MSHNPNEFPIGTIVNPEEYSFRLEIVRHGENEVFAKVIKAEYLYPNAQAKPFQVGQELRFVPGISWNFTNMWNLDSHNWWFTLWAEYDSEGQPTGKFRFEHYR